MHSVFLTTQKPLVALLVPEPGQVQVLEQGQALVLGQAPEPVQHKQQQDRSSMPSP
jgi:hypothetical protein